MTYIIADRVVTFNNSTLGPEEEALVRAHPDLFRACLNSTVHGYVLSMKKVVHLYADIMTIYSTLLLKIPNYDDITRMATVSGLHLQHLEEDLNFVFGKSVTGLNEGWEHIKYEQIVKPAVLLMVRRFNEVFEHVLKTLKCIDLFFLAFDNLRKLLIPSLLNHTRMVQKLTKGVLYFVGLTTIVDELADVTNYASVVKQLTKIDSITCGIKREAKLLDMVFCTVDTLLHQYTNVLLGRAILKREVEDHECRIIKRRDVCFQAAEHVVSIPLTGDHVTAILMLLFSRYVFYLVSAVLLVVALMLYRLYAVIFGS